MLRVEGGGSADLLPGVNADDRASAIAKTGAFLARLRRRCSALDPWSSSVTG